MTQHPPRHMRCPDWPKSLRIFFAPFHKMNFFFSKVKGGLETSILVLEQKRGYQSTQRASNRQILSRKIIRKVYGNFRNFSKMTLFLVLFQTAVTHLRNVRLKHFFIPKCRQFYSASFDKIKKGGTRSLFFAIFEKLKKSRFFLPHFSI